MMNNPGEAWPTPEDVAFATEPYRLPECRPWLEPESLAPRLGTKFAVNESASPVMKSRRGTDIVERIGTQVRLQAMVNGKSRYPVSVFLLDDNSLLTTDVLNLSARKSREAVAAQVDDTLRAEVLQLATELGHVIVARQVERPERDRRKVAPPTELEPWSDSVATDRILEAVSSQLTEYVVLPVHEVTATALWVLHTYVTDVTDYTPYLRVYSPVRECGKSTLLEWLANVARRAQLTGGITAAALYRRIDRLTRVDRSTPTMLLDELDARLRGDGGEALRGVLNTGFHRSGRVTICVGDTHEERDFQTFCPKVLSGIGRLWDTVASRSIPIRMERAHRDQLAGIRKIRHDRISAETSDLRRQLTRWAQDYKAALRDCDPDVPHALGARQSDVWRPLLAIAEQAGEAWTQRASHAALALYRASEDEADHGLLLLEDVRDLLEAQSAGVIFTAAIIEALINREDRPWPEYRHDKPITPRGVAALLGRFKVKPVTVRIGTSTGKGYRAQDLAPAFQKYLPNKQADASSNAAVTSVTLRCNDATRPGVTLMTDRNQCIGVFTDEQLERSGIQQKQTR